MQGSIIVPSADCPKDGSATCIHNRGGTYGNVTVNVNFWLYLHLLS